MAPAEAAAVPRDACMRRETIAPGGETGAAFVALGVVAAPAGRLPELRNSSRETAREVDE